MIRVKEQYKHVIIGFKNSGNPLGLRSQAELVYLYELAKKKKNQWLDFFEFETEPDESKIEEIKVQDFNMKRSRRRGRKSEKS